MLPSNQIILKKEKTEYPPIPSNIYQVELLDINLEEKPAYKQPDKIENVYSFQFVLLAGKDKDGSSLRGRNIWANFVPSYFYIGKNGKNNLYKIVEGLIGRELSQEEEANMSTDFINSLIGKQVRILVDNKPNKEGKVYSRIENYLPIETDYPSLTAEEKEKATVKKQEPVSNDIPLREDEEIETPTEEIRLEDIPYWRHH